MYIRTLLVVFDGCLSMWFLFCSSRHWPVTSGGAQGRVLSGLRANIHFLLLRFFFLHFSSFLRSHLSKNNVRVRGSSCTKQKYEYHQSVEDIFFGILGILRGRFGLSWIVLILGKGFWDLNKKKISACILWENLMIENFKEEKKNLIEAKVHFVSIGWETLCTNDFLRTRVHHIENHEFTIPGSLLSLFVTSCKCLIFHPGLFSYERTRHMSWLWHQ